MLAAALFEAVKQWAAPIPDSLSDAFGTAGNAGRSTRV